MMQPPGGPYYGYGDYSQGLPPPHHPYGDYPLPNYYPGHPPPRQHSPYHHQPEPPPPPKPVTIRSRPTTAEEGSSSKPRSNPIQAPLEDTLKLLLEYFEWQIRRNPSEVVDIEYAYERLHDERHSLEQISKFEASDWREYEIQKGLGFRLKKQIKDFLIERKGGKGGADRGGASGGDGGGGLNTLAEAAFALQNSTYN